MITGASEDILYLSLVRGTYCGYSDRYIPGSNKEVKTVEILLIILNNSALILDESESRHGYGYIERFSFN